MAVANGAALYGAYGEYTVTGKCPQSYGFETSRPFHPVIDCPDHISPGVSFDATQFVNKTACWALKKVCLLLLIFF